jgi:hypothetical protein
MIGQVQLLDGPWPIIFLPGVNDGHDKFNKLIAGFVQYVRVMDDLFMKLNVKCKTTCDPVTVDFDDGDVDDGV